MKNCLKLFFFFIALVGTIMGLTGSAFAECACFTKNDLRDPQLQTENPTTFNIIPQPGSEFISIILELVAEDTFANRLPGQCIKSVPNEDPIMFRLTEDEMAECVRLMNNNIPDPS